MATTLEKSLGIALVATVVIAAIVVLTYSYRISNVGRVKGIGVSVYSDALCTNRLTMIDWGVIGPNEVKGVIAYVRNEKNTNVTLDMSTSNWVPWNISTALSCTWNYTVGSKILVGEVSPPYLVSLISNSNLYWFPSNSTFSFDININATEIS